MSSRKRADSVVSMLDGIVVKDYSVKEADVVLSKLGIKHIINASGYIGYQSVSAGTVINSDTEVTLN